MNLNSLTPQLTKYLKVFRYGDRLRPLRDWWIIVVVGFVLLVGSAGWSYWLFQMTSNEETVAGPAAPAPQVKTNSLDAIQAIFGTRTTERTHYLTDYHFVDPSH